MSLFIHLVPFSSTHLTVASSSTDVVFCTLIDEVIDRQLFARLNGAQSFEVANTGTIIQVGITTVVEATEIVMACFYSRALNHLAFHDDLDSEDTKAVNGTVGYTIRVHFRT
jgi:hypothetical protein